MSSAVITLQRRIAAEDTFNATGGMPVFFHFTIAPASHFPFRDVRTPANIGNTTLLFHDEFLQSIFPTARVKRARALAV
jgi:hypothetical protein